MTTTFNAIRVLVNRSELVTKTAVPVDATVFNAPRPLFGMMWQGPFVTGVHYAAVLVDDPYRGEWLANNKRQDATLILFVTEAEARQMVADYLPTIGYNDVSAEDFEMIWLDNFYDQFARTMVEVA